jgi:hypothetical protein
VTSNSLLDECAQTHKTVLFSTSVGIDRHPLLNSVDRAFKLLLTHTAQRTKACISKHSQPLLRHSSLPRTRVLYFLPQPLAQMCRHQPLESCRTQTPLLAFPLHHRIRIHTQLRKSRRTPCRHGRRDLRIPGLQLQSQRNSLVLPRSHAATP